MFETIFKYVWNYLRTYLKLPLNMFVTILPVQKSCGNANANEMQMQNLHKLETIFKDVQMCVELSSNIFGTLDVPKYV